MSFDSTCRRLAEQFPEDFASWLLGRPINSVILKPTELSLEPIRADNLMLIEGDADILHIEWQTDPKQVIPMRLADYRLRIYRKAPDKHIHQVVIYLRQTNSELVHQNFFEIAGMYAEYEVIRIWEVPASDLMRFPGLLPFAVLGQTNQPEQTLREAVRAMKQIADPIQQNELMGAAYLLGGLVLDRELIGKVIRRDVMRESVTYQAVLQEGREEGRQEKAVVIARNLLQQGMTIALIAQVTGLTIAEVEALTNN
jgi:predicted transposase/invertase (TIGR01784 family)